MVLYAKALKSDSYKVVHCDNLHFGLSYVAVYLKAVKVDTFYYSEWYLSVED